MGYAMAKFSGDSSNRLLWCKFHEYNSQADLGNSIAEAVSELELDDCPTYWMLQPSHYQLLLLDALQVSEEEMAAAARWRIKDLIEFPVEQSAVDVFAIPPHGVGGQKKKMYVVAARLAYLKGIASILESSGLNLQHIAITELGLGKLAKYYIQGQQSAAILHLTQQRAEIIIVQQDKLYLSRNLNLEIEQIESNSFQNREETKLLDDLTLEIQRTYDYCVSELALNIPSKLLLTPRAKMYPEVTDYLAKNLDTKLDIIDLNDVVKTDYPLDWQIQAQCLVAIAGGIGQTTDMG